MDAAMRYGMGAFLSALKVQGQLVLERQEKQM